MILKKRSKIPWREVANRAVILHPAQNQVHELNESAAFLWKSLNNQASVNELVQILTENFDVDQKTAEGDVLEFLETLRKADLLETT